MPQVLRYRRATEFDVHPKVAYSVLLVAEFEAPGVRLQEPLPLLEALLATPEFREGWDFGPFPLHGDPYWASPITPADFTPVSLVDVAKEAMQWTGCDPSTFPSESEIARQVEETQQELHELGVDIEVDPPTPLTPADVAHVRHVLDRAMEEFGRPPWLFRLVARTEAAAGGRPRQWEYDALEFVGLWPEGLVKVFVLGDD